MITADRATERADTTTPSRPSSPDAPTSAATRIAPPGGWQWVDLGELWRYRELVYFLVWRDVKVRYKQTALGAAWAILQPLMMMTVFTIFFGRLAGVPSGGVPYPLFAIAGLLPWTFFAAAITSAANSVVGSERLLTKIYFPRLAMPLAAVGAAVVDFAVAMTLMVAMMAWYRVPVTPSLLLAPPIFAGLTLVAVGLGTLLAALNVAYRDFRYVLPFLVQVGMFATPSIYMQIADDSAPAASRPAASAPTAPATPPAASAGEARGADHAVVRAALALNPVTEMIAAFRASLLGGTIRWARLGASIAASLALLAVGCAYFRRVEHGFADII